jgi:phosphoglycerate dehydrogenase-like enzyme
MKVLFCGEYLGSERSQDVLERLIPDAEIVTCARSAIRDSLAGVDVVCPWGAAVDASLMDAGTFGLVQQFGVGLEKVDVAAATDHGIWVARLPGELTGNADSVAEIAVLHLLALSRRLDEARQTVRDGGWGGPVGRSLAGKTVLIVGLGAIGSAVAARLRPFGVRLTGIRAHPANGGPVDKVGGPEELPEMLGEADAVICAAMYDGGDTRMFGGAAFAAMRRGALFVNVARGGLVDEPALIAALDSGQIGGAGLDVFAGEPNPGPLARHPRVLATPHAGALTDHMLQLSARLFTENIHRWAAGENPHWAVNHPATRCG